MIGWHRDHDGARQSFFAEYIVDELLDLAPTFANQTDHHHVCIRIARHHAKQDGLAHTGTGKQTKPLSPADAEQRIDGTNTDIQRVTYRRPSKGIDVTAVQRPALRGMQMPFAVQRITTAIDDPTQQFITHRSLADAAGGDYTRVRLQSPDIACGHQIKALAGEADHFGLNPVSCRIDDITATAYRCATANRLEGESNHPGQFAFHHQAATVVNTFAQAPDARRPDRIAVRLRHHEDPCRRRRASVRRRARGQ